MSIKTLVALKELLSKLQGLGHQGYFSMDLRKPALQTGVLSGSKCLKKLSRCIVGNVGSSLDLCFFDIRGYIQDKIC